MESFNKQEQLVELPTNGGQNSVVGEVQKRSRNKKNKTVNKVSNFQTRDDLTPLMRAATDKDCMVLLELLTKQNYSSSLFLKDRRGRTALDWARLSRNYVAVTLLTKAMSTNISNARLDAISYNNLDYQTYIVTTNNNSFHALYAAVKDRDSKTAMRILNDNLLYREEVEAIPVADGNSISSLGNSYGAGATSDNSQKKEVFFTDKELFHKNTLLILASGLNMLDVVYKLIELGTPIDHQNKYGHTALTYACCIGHAEVVRHLLHKGADIFKQTQEGCTGLHYACMYAKAKIVKTILIFLLEKFSVYRLTHTSSYFDPSRWTTYADLLEKLFNVRKFYQAVVLCCILSRLQQTKSRPMKDNNGYKAIDLLPTTENDPIYIENRLKLSLVKNIANYNLASIDDRSLMTMRSLADVSSEQKDLYYEHDEDDDLSDYHLKVDDLKNSFTADGQGAETDLLNEDGDVAPKGESEAIDEVASQLSDEGSIFSVEHSIDGWSHDTDKMHATGIHYITDAYSVATAMALPQEISKIREIFSQTYKRINVWILNADKERDLGTLVTCTLKCGLVLKVEDMTSHIRDDCPLRTVTCPQCTSAIIYHQLEMHMKRKCPKRIVGCPNAYKGCKELIFFDATDTHLHLKCLVRPMYCRQFCEALIPFNQRDNHEQNHCMNRTINCDQCNVELLAKEFTDHLHNKCENRWVRCSVSCGEKFLAKDLKDHEENDCVKFCKLCCGIKIGPKEKRMLHEMYECLNRPKQCQYNCGAIGLVAANVEDHEKNICLLCPTSCPNGCGASLTKGSVGKHVDTWLGSCSKRLVRCPSNYVGRQIQLLPSGEKGLVLRYKRDVDQKINNPTSPSADEDSLDQLYIQLQKNTQWFNYWNTTMMPMKKVQSSNPLSINGNSIVSHLDSQDFQCGWIFRDEVHTHLKHHCIHRNFYVKSRTDINSLPVADMNGAGSSLKPSTNSIATSETKSNVIDSNLVENHFKEQSLSPSSDQQLQTTLYSNGNKFLETISRTLAEDTLTVNAKALSSHFLGQQTTYKDILQMSEQRKELDTFHENDVLNPAMVHCQFCNKYIHRESLEDHHQKNCKDVLVRCPFGCGSKLLRKLLEEHTSNQCPKRTVTCPQCHSNDLWAEEIEDHVANTCLSRPATCCYSCGDITLTVSTVDSHCAHDCSLRPVQCECGLTFKHIEMEEHLRLDCINELVFCPQGCNAQIKRCDVYTHIEFDCSNKNYKYQKFCDCRLGCGERLMLRDMLHHVSYDCVKRLIECSLKCGAVMQLYKLKDHLTFCPMRVVSCEPGMKSCERQLHSWVRKHTEDGVETVYSLTDGDEYTKDNKKVDSVVITKSHKDGSDVVSTVSYYHEANQMKFYRELRMCSCSRHGSSLAMASLKYDDYNLAEQLMKQLKESADIDVENLYGDTLLTMACRMGKLKFVELFVQHGADVNLETSYGRTALIEAVKAEEENVPLIEYLLKSGSIASYKTAKHRKSALSWAKVLKRSYSARILDLAEVVQRQSNLIFQAISCGDFEVVHDIIKEGDFFNVENEDKAYEEMKRYALLTEKYEAELNSTRNIVSGLTEQVEQAHKVLVKQEEALKASVDNLNNAFADESEARKAIAHDFSLFEKKALKLSSVDIEEILVIKNKNYSLRLALFIYGIVFEVLDIKEYDADCAGGSVEVMKKWYLSVVKSLRKSNEALLRIRGYSIDKVQSARNKELLLRARSYYNQLSTAYADDVANHQFNNSQTFNSEMFGMSGIPISSSRRGLLRRSNSRSSRSKSPKKGISPRRSVSPGKQLRQFSENSLEKTFDSQFRSTLNDSARSASPKKLQFATDLSIDTSSFSLYKDNNAGPNSQTGLRPGSDRVSAVNPTRTPHTSQKQDDFEWYNASDRAGQLDLSVYRPDSDAVHQLSRPSSVLSDAPLEDADWDPDAEQGGQWVKGEWVPAPNVTDKWWEKTPAERRYLQELRKRNTRDEEAKKAKERRKNSRVVYLSDAKIQEEVQKNTTLKKEIEDRQSDNYQQSLRKSLGLSLSRSGSLSRSATPKKSNSLIVISSPNTPQSMDRRSPNKATDNINREFIVASTPQAVSTINNFADTNWSDMFAQTGGSLQENVEEDDVEGSRFIGVILLQIAAIITYDEDSHKILALKTEVARLSVIREEEREKRDESLTAYQEKVEHRAKVEEELIATIKHVKFNKNKTRVFREKVRVARLMNRTSVNGHTLISWAAAHGSYDIVEDMLTHGATVGYTNQLLHLTATYLQLSYKIFIMSYTMRTKKKGNENENKYAIVDEQLRQDTQAGSVAFIAELEEAKAKRAKVLQNMRFQRSRHRFPVPEAVYAGKWEIVQRIYNRRLLHVHFMNSWIFPAPPPPFRRGFSHSYEHHKISIEYIMAQAINDLAAGAYLPEIGWIPPGDERDPYGEMQMELQKILDALAEKRNAFLAGRERIRALAKEKKNQTKGAEEMMKAIEQRDFRKCIFLAQRRGISIDTETANGYTPLLAAAEENVNMVNHEYMKNDDGRPCLAVEYLLDRSYYRPSINLETNKDSHTALMRACLYGRFHVLEALLDRGANINQVNRKGKTALHYAVEIGNEECVRILVERFADQTIQDANDKTAFKIAEELNFTGIMQLLSQFGSGFLGPIQVSRGRVNNTVRCPIGCGAELLPRQAGAHCLVCEWREVECTLGCGIKRLSAKELADHVKDSCVKRLITCKHCSVMCMYDEMPVHLTESCDFRIIPCPNRCGKNYQAYDMERHLMVCEHKTVECPQKCGKFMKMVECFDHVNTDCINRRVSCPLKCRGLIVYKLLQSHMETVCPFRLVQCRFCHEEMVKQVVEQHEKECDLRTRSCPWKCGEILPVKLFNEHKSSSCKHRFIDCLNGCNVKARVVDMDKHLKNECALRLIPCSLGCIVCNDVPESEREITQVVAKFHEYHIKYDCIERKSKCSLCLELVKAKDKDLHAAEQCQKRIVNCRTPGCLKSLPFDERLDHERFNCRFRQVLCAQGCGENITYLHAGIHMQRHCTKRIAPCPLNCGEKMPFLHIDEHLKYVCPRRYSKSSNVTDCTTSPADANSVNSSPHLMSMSNTDIVSVLSKQGSKLSLLRSLSQQSGLSINLDASVRYSRPASPANTVGTFGTFGTEEIVTDTTDK